MALNIDGATFGYDIAGTQAFLNELKASYLDQAASDARNTDEIFTSVDESWVGQAAEDFKIAINEDCNALSRTLEQLYEQLESQINNISSSIADTDAGLMSNLR